MYPKWIIKVIFKNKKRTTNWRTKESRRALSRKQPVKIVIRNPASGGNTVLTGE